MPKTNDKAWLELQVISAVHSLREIDPQHPFVLGIKTMLDLAKSSGQYEQLELDLERPVHLCNQAE